MKKLIKKYKKQIKKARKISKGLNNDSKAIFIMYEAALNMVVSDLKKYKNKPNND